METEIGHIADLLASTESEKTPLQKQLDSLSKIIATIAGVALVLVVVIGLARGESFDDLFITGVALAVAAIPTGLPAVVTALLSIGTREIASRNAIVKRLPAVETLGFDIGDLLRQDGHPHPQQDDRPRAGDPRPEPCSPSPARATAPRARSSTSGGATLDLDPYLLPMVLCADAVLGRGEPHRRPHRGRPHRARRRRAGSTSTRPAPTYPRIAEVPFDSEYKFMATFHEMTGADGRPVVRCYVKGAPDVLIAKGGSYLAPDGALVPVTDENRHAGLRCQRPAGRRRRSG